MKLTIIIKTSFGKQLSWDNRGILSEQTDRVVTKYKKEQGYTYNDQQLNVVFVIHRQTAGEMDSGRNCWNNDEIMRRFFSALSMASAARLLCTTFRIILELLREKMEIQQRTTKGISTIKMELKPTKRGVENGFLLKFA